MSLTPKEHAGIERAMREMTPQKPRRKAPATATSRPGDGERNPFAEGAPIPPPTRAKNNGQRQAQPPATVQAEQDDAPPATEDTEGDALKPAVILPRDGDNRIINAAESLGGALAATRRYFARGDSVVTVSDDDSGSPILKVLKPAALASVFEEVAELKQFSKLAGGGEVPATCSEATAKLIASCQRFTAKLPPIKVLSRCPVLVERDGQLIEVTGYDLESGTMAGGDPAVTMDVADARDLLSQTIADFNFATPADRSRALAAMVTPALLFGGLLGGRAPIDLGEADSSQAGKGYRNKVSAAGYRHDVRAITQQKGGVGGLEEKFNANLIAGRPFICFDNVRGKIDSQSLESFLTEDTYLARVPYGGNIDIDPRRVVVAMTSNKAEVTIDLANRSSCVRILKQADGYRFRKYPEGDVLDHVRANQPQFLGAVFSIVRAWHAAGKPQLDEVRHDFRRWARVLGWIVENLLDAAPMLDGHRETQERMTNPALTWLRDVALAVKKAGKLGRELRAFELLDMIDGSDVAVPGMAAGDDLHNDGAHKKALQAIGRELGKCFREGDMVSIDAFAVTRNQTTDSLSRPSKSYEFAEVQKTPCSADVPYCSPNGSPNKSLVSPISPGETGHGLYAPAHAIGDVGSTRGDSGDRGNKGIISGYWND